MELINEKIQYLLLDYVIELRLNITTLCNKDSLEGYTIYHNLQKNELINLLEDLYNKKLIVIYPARHSALELTEEDFYEIRIFPIREIIKNAVYNSGVDKFYWYGVTPRGGRQWEMFFNVNWNYYYYYTFDENGNAEAFAGSLNILQEYLKYLEIFHQFKIKSISWDIIKNWNATYWKILSEGYRVRFTCDPPNAIFYGIELINIDDDIKRSEDLEKISNKLIKMGEWRKDLSSIPEFASLSKNFDSNCSGDQ